MWKLKPLDLKQEQLYEQLFLSELIARRDKATIPSSYLRNFLTDDILKELLTAKPDRLIAIHKLFVTKVPLSFFWPSLEAIFDYKELISSQKRASYAIAEMIGQNTCIYCNRIYTSTVFGKYKKRIIRPDFDHWYAKSKYPLLALSLYNLIPSCPFCNSRLKGAKEFNPKDHVHPYIDDPHPDYFRFIVNYATASQPRIDIAIEGNAHKTKNMLELLRIQEIYASHDRFELKDMVELNYRYPPLSIEVLLQYLEGCGITESDALRYIFGIDTNQPLNYPLGKYRNDILRWFKEANNDPSKNHLRRLKPLG